MAVAKSIRTLIPTPNALLTLSVKVYRAEGPTPLTQLTKNLLQK